MHKLGYHVVLLSSGIGLEVSAYPKPGNVHRLIDHEDTWFEDFIITSNVFTYWLYRGAVRGYYKRYNRYTIGDLIYGIVADSMLMTGGGNTCLGSSLLLTPLSLSIGELFSEKKQVDINDLVRKACSIVEKHSTVHDTIMFYKAIRKASPSYIKETDETHGYPNVWSPSYQEEILRGNISLWRILKYSSRNDIVANEVVNCYKASMDAMKFLSNRLDYHRAWNRAIVETYLYLLSKIKDTVIIRKYGMDWVENVMEFAGYILDKVIVAGKEWMDIVMDFDRKLQSMNCNPGSIADLTASAISLYSLWRKRSILRI